MANTGAEYTVTVNKTGDGATQAVNDFKAVAGAAAKSNTTLATHTAAMAAVTTSTKTASASLKALHGTLTLVGMTAFPQLTMSATAAVHTMKGLADVAKLSGIGLSAMGAALAVVATVAYTAKVAMDSFKASAQWDASSSALAGQVEKFGGSVIDKRDQLRGRISDMGKAGSITPEWAGALNKQLTQGGTDTEVRSNLVWIKKNLDEIEAKAKVVGPALQQMTAMESALAIEVQTGFDREREAARRNYMERLDQISAMSKALDGSHIEELENLRMLAAESLKVKEAEINAARAAEQARLDAAKAGKEEVMVWKEVEQQQTQVQEILDKGVKLFSTGFAHAFVEFASGTKKAGEAFREFAASFLKTMAEMIIEQIAFNTISGLLKSLAGGVGAGAGGGVDMAYAQGGIKFAANGLAGVGSVSSPTYFPRFNVVAGEAGREMLTVLARPRMMEVGGMQAVVGSAQGRQLAITSASDLARGGAGGTIVIQVQGTPDFEARVVSNSVKGAVVQVANDMRQDTPIARGVKGLTA